MIYRQPDHHRNDPGAPKKSQKPEHRGEDWHRMPLYSASVQHYWAVIDLHNRRRCLPLPGGGCYLLLDVVTRPCAMHVRRLERERMVSIWTLLTKSNIGNLSWRENVFKLSVNEAGYCTAGPLRAPWRIIPQEVKDNSKKIAAYWKGLCEKYPLAKQEIRKTA
jgi:hypothetical protein